MANSDPLNSFFAGAQNLAGNLEACKFWNLQWFLQRLTAHPGGSGAGIAIPDRTALWTVSDSRRMMVHKMQVALHGSRSSFSHLRSVAKLKPRPSSVARVGTPALQSDKAGSRVDSEDVFSFETNSSAALKTEICIYSLPRDEERAVPHQAAV